MLPELVRRLNLPQSYPAPTVMGPYEDPFPAWSPPETAMGDQGGFPQATAQVDPRAALLERRNQAFQGLRSAVDQPPVAQPTPRMGVDPKKAGIIAAIALLSKLFDKSGNLGTGLVGGFTQGQEMLNQQDFAKQVADASAQAQSQKVKQALAEMMLQEANLGLSDYDRQEGIEYGRREDARHEFINEQHRKDALELQKRGLEYTRLKDKETGDRQLQDDLRAEATNFNARYGSARQSTANWDDAAAGVWAKQREQLKARGIPGEWLAPVAPAGSQTVAVAGQVQRGEQFDWTKGIREEYLNIAKDRAARAENQIPKDVTAKRAAIAKADERIIQARHEVDMLIEAGPEDDMATFGKAVQMGIANEAFEVNRKRKLMGLPELKPMEYAGQRIPFLKDLPVVGSLFSPKKGNVPVNPMAAAMIPDAKPAAAKDPAKYALAKKIIEQYYAQGRAAKPGDPMHDPLNVMKKVREVKAAYKRETGQEFK